MQTNAIKDYVRFHVLGLEVEVSETDAAMLTIIAKKKAHYQNVKNQVENFYNRTAYVIDLYDDETKAAIFNLKGRKGLEISFYNTHGWKGIIDSVITRPSGVTLKWHFERNPDKSFFVSLKRFLELVSKGDFHAINPKEFKDAYFTKLDLKLKILLDQEKLITAKYDAAYKEKEAALKMQYNEELAKSEKLQKEAKKKVELTAETAETVAKKHKGAAAVKDFWNSSLTETEKATVMDWIAEHIYSIRVYGLASGQSGNTLENNYREIEGIKYREPEYNDEGKLTSQDSITAHISFKNIENAPVELLKKICSNKRTESFFYNNRLNDKNLALFLLAEYGQYGFKAGVRNLNKEIKH